jgi:hypothetical protein
MFRYRSAPYLVAMRLRQAHTVHPVRAVQHAWALTASDQCRASILALRAARMSGVACIRDLYLS